MSSNQALQKVKHLYNAKKAGHTGSLDPLATGLLPICLGQATKISEYLLNSHKKYTTVIKLGQTTDTLDSEGQVLESLEVNVSDELIESSLPQFRGQIKQIPPMFSALKKDGQPLYKLARKGEQVDRPARDMTVYGLTAQRIDRLHVRLNVHCSSGFYIRSLAHDLGQVLGCGAHVVELRRTAIKDIGLESAISLEQLHSSANPKTQILPLDCLLADMPITNINSEQAASLLQGRATASEGIESCVLTRFYVDDSALFAIGEVGDDGALKTHKIFIFNE